MNSGEFNIQEWIRKQLGEPISESTKSSDCGAPKMQESMCLKDKITIPERTELFDPAKFYQNSDDLCVLSDFQIRVLPVAKPVQLPTVVMISSFDLINSDAEAESCNGLLNDHDVFENASIFCVCLANIIIKQRNGENGYLLNNGASNLFPVIGINGRCYVVCVVRAGCMWTIDVFWFDDQYSWSSGVGNRIFLVSTSY